jgi:two-component system sensor histidine kinase BaeS
MYRARFIFAKRYLKYFLVWPLFRAYRGKLRRSLRWRLADSHVTAVWSSVIGLCVISLVMTVIWAWVAFPNEGELKDETSRIASIVSQYQQPNTTNADVSALLNALGRGLLDVNPNRNSANFAVNVGGNFANIRSISIVSTDGVVTASSNPAYVNQPIDQAFPRAADVSSQAIASAPSSNRQFSARFSDGGAIGTAKIRDSAGNTTGILVLDKTKLTYPSFFSLVRDAVTLIFQVGLVILILVGLPAIPVSIFIGIKRGRSIARPISALAVASEQLASGNLDTRVTPSGEDEIGTLQRGFNSMAARLQESMQRESDQRLRSDELLAANRELIANVSHELRTPVALIRGHLEAIEGESEGSAGYLRIAVRETDRLERLVDDLFQLTRLESKRLSLDLAPFDPSSAAREAVEALAEPARREAGILVRAEAHSGDGQCDGDRARFVQVLMNLIRNAIRYTPEGGIILVSTQGRATTIEVTVRDTGSGIPPEDLPHVFDRFYRADPSRNRASGGAGLGLAIARELIEAMGGRISVESVVDEGTAFTIEMPRAVSPLASNGYSMADARSK